MPKIREYQSQISPNQGIEGRRATAAAFGGDGGLGVVGQSLSSAAGLMQKQAERRDLSTLYGGFAKARSELTISLREQENTGAINEVEFLENFTGQVKDRLEALSESMQTRLGRETAAARGVMFAANFRQISSEAKSVATGQLIRANHSETLNTNRNVVLSDPLQADDVLQEMLFALNDPAGPYAGISKSTLREFITDTTRGLALSEVQGYIENVSPEIAKQLLADGKWDTRLNADNKARLMSLADRAILKNTEIAEDDLRLQIDQVIKEGGNPLNLIRGGVESELFSSEAAQALRGYYSAFVEHKRKVAAAEAAFRVGSEVDFFPAASNIKKEAAEGWMAERLVGYKDLPPEQRKEVMGDVVRKGVRMGYKFTGIQALLSVTPHGDSFGEAADTYRSLEAFDPYYASSFVSADQSVRFDVYENAIKGGATEETALDMARLINTEALAKAKQFFKTPDGQLVVEDLQIAMLDIPWTSDDTINARFATDTVLERAKTMLAANPSADVEVVLKAAQKAFQAKNVIVNDLWVPRDFVAGVPFDEMENIVEGLLSRLPKVLAANELPFLEGDYVLSPDIQSDTDKKLQVFDPTGAPVPGLRFGAEDMQKEYRRLQSDAFERKHLKQRAVSTWGGVSLDD